MKPSRVREWKRRLNVWWSGGKFYIPPFVNTLIAILSYTVGYHMSSPGEGLPLARAGALTTAVSVLFTLWSYQEILARSERRGPEAYARALKMMNITLQDPDRLLQGFATRLSKNTARINRVISIWQALLPFMATLVWGFGDLLFAGPAS